MRFIANFEINVTVKNFKIIPKIQFFLYIHTFFVKKVKKVKSQK